MIGGKNTSARIQRGGADCGAEWIKPHDYRSAAARLLRRASGDPRGFYVLLTPDSQFAERNVSRTEHWWVRSWPASGPAAATISLARVWMSFFAREADSQMKEPRILVQPGHGGLAFDRQLRQASSPDVGRGRTGDAGGVRQPGRSLAGAWRGPATRIGRAGSAGRWARPAHSAITRREPDARAVRWCPWRPGGGLGQDRDLPAPGRISGRLALRPFARFHRAELCSGRRAGYGPAVGPPAGVASRSRGSSGRA